MSEIKARPNRYSALHTGGVTGSIPVAPTIQPIEITAICNFCIKPTAHLGAARSRNMRFRYVENPWILFAGCSRGFPA